MDEKDRRNTQLDNCINNASSKLVTIYLFGAFNATEISIMRHLKVIRWREGRPELLV